MQKKQGIILLSVGLFAVLLLGLAAVWKYAAPRPENGEKRITVEVIHKDRSSKSFVYQTDAEYLGDLLKAEGLISGTEGEFGLFVHVVDGETADFSVDGGWWRLTHNGEEAQAGADLLPIRDGDQFCWVYTIG